MIEFERKRISLSGEWMVTLNNWEEPDKKINARVQLPGTLDEHQLGPNTGSDSDRVARKFGYEGPARYERTVTIPKSWGDKTIYLKMERSRVTDLWIDGRRAGFSNTLSTAQILDVSDYLTPGEHNLAIIVDNGSGVMSWKSTRYSHIAVEYTQQNWNGILGDIELYATHAVHITRVRLFPQTDGSIQGRTVLRKPYGTSATGQLFIQVLDSTGSEAIGISDIPFSMEAIVEEVTVEFNVEQTHVLDRWDEFTPHLYSLKVWIEGNYLDQKIVDTLYTPLSNRVFGVSGTQFTINGNKTFLRGTNETGVFPLTGYAPMGIEDWLSIFRLAKSYGINHYRFHSWCPPEAAFEAADRIGIYLQPELPLWDSSAALENDEEWHFYLEEVYRILESYGNHPSFVMLAWGNELYGSLERMEELINRARQWDPTKLYTIGSNNFFIKAQMPRNADYWTTFHSEGTWNTRKSGYGGKLVRGSTPHPTKGHINNHPPSTRTDYRDAIKDVPIPIVAHEIGQFSIHPSFSEMEKFTGVLGPGLLTRYRELARVSGLLHQAEAFQNASGRLASLSYREEIEAALRTPGLAGFQLLDLKDYFPGGSGAFVGIFDAFMDSKGVVEQEEWRKFCSEVVPLIRMKRFTWSEGERFRSEVQVVNYGPSEIGDAIVTWTIYNEIGREIASGNFHKITIRQGELTAVGFIDIIMPHVEQAEKWRLRTRIDETSYQLEYPLWIYPDREKTIIPSSVFVSDSYDQWTRGALDKGKSVLLIPPAHGSFGHGPEGGFIPDFWCYSSFKKYDPPGTLGILIDHLHPALKGFPTETYAEWQWWHLMRNSRAIVLDGVEPDYQPIVQVIDNVERQHKLGILFEAKVGKGKLLICSIDLWSQLDRPEATEFLRSLLQYCSSDLFNPVLSWEDHFVQKLFDNKSWDKLVTDVLISDTIG